MTTFVREQLRGYRQSWWNEDFLDLMGERWRLKEVKRVLDLGCGLGHWSRQLFRMLPPRATILGGDISGTLLAAAREDLAESAYALRFQVLQTDVYRLPLEAESVDMVTCQTLLIHVGDLDRVLGEVLRVLRPGGLLAVAEPNNLARCLFFNSLTRHSSVPTILRTVRARLLRERDKARAGGGDDSVGNLLPEHFLRSGFTEVQSFMSDKMTLVGPGLDGGPGDGAVEQLLDWNPTKPALHEALETRMLHAAVPSLMCLTSGRKPGASLGKG